jgi:rRNA maturation endonuclease Nob1
MNSTKPEKAVVDANVLIHSRAQFPFKEALIPPSVEKEIKSQMAEFKAQKLELEVFQPSETVLEKVVEKSGKINSPTSEQDEEALALALERDIPLVTDDKALQNLSLHLDADFQGFNTEEVSEKRRWKTVCENCGKEVSSPPCPRCGDRSLRRKRDQRS